MTQDKSGSTRAFERAHPEDPANAPGWDKHVDEFFNSEAFPGDGVRKATDAMRQGEPHEILRGSSQGNSDPRSLPSGGADPERKTRRPPEYEPGQG